MTGAAGARGAPAAKRPPARAPVPGDTPHLVDRVGSAYLAASALAAAACHARCPGWALLVALHAAALAAQHALIRSAAAHPRSRALQGLRLLYPIALYAWGWSEVERFTPMVFGGYPFTASLFAADRAIFGAPPDAWMPRLYSPWLDETMTALYSGYFLMPLLAVYLLRRGRRDALLAALSVVLLDYALNYALFPVFPALDPRMAHAAAGHPVTEFGGFLFARITRTLEAGGGIPGGCFPSSHVSASVAWCLSAWAWAPRVAPAFTVIAAGVTVSTVYLLYHHGVDSLTGLALGALSFFAARALLKARGELPA